MKCVLPISIHESYYASISAMSDSFHSNISCEKCLCDLYVKQWSHYVPTANHHLYIVLKKEWGHKWVQSISAIRNTQLQQSSYQWKYWRQSKLINNVIFLRLMLRAAYSSGRSRNFKRGFQLDKNASPAWVEVKKKSLPALWVISHLQQLQPVARLIKIYFLIPSDKHNSSPTTNLISSLIDIILSQDAPFHQQQQLHCLQHGAIFIP